MIELIDRDTSNKIMAMIFGKITYREDAYLIYCIRRGKEDANIFVSRLVPNSEGLVLVDDFVNGEKEVLEGIIQKLLNKVSILELEQDGFSLSSDVSLDGSLYFDIKKCYVTTVPKNLIKECMLFYELVVKSVFERPVVDVVEEKGYFNKGFVSNIGLILFGLIVFVFCVVAIIGVLFG